jgi:uncharacterized protein (TIGR03118 family)
MKKCMSKNWINGLIVALSLCSCQKNANQFAESLDQPSQQSSRLKALKDLTQVNLVGDNSDFNPQSVDADLVNPWGIAFAANGPIWISSMGTGWAKVSNSDGMTIRTAIGIPSPTLSQGGHPTGVVLNTTTGFRLDNGNPARFIYAGADGVISAWNGGPNAIRKVTDAGELYLGIAAAADNGKDLLYVANFSSGKIEVFDTSWKEVNKTFNDPLLPDGYSPFNIQNINGKLFVMYAKKSTVPGQVVSVAKGNGYVDVFNADGSFERRFASAGNLNAPWGVTKVPTAFLGEDELDREVILIGNFGDGYINAFNTEGKSLGKVRAHNAPVQIEGLWGIAFAPSTSTTIGEDKLYFAAGPGGEQHGLFGYLRN